MIGTESLRKVVTPSNGIMEAELFAECQRLSATRVHHERVGVDFWPDITPDLTEPEGPGECGICTNGARIIARKFRGYVAGYPIRFHPPFPDSKQLVGYDCCGHDFAIVGEYLIDWWAWAHEESIPHPVMLVTEAISSGRYKPMSEWKPFACNDFRTQPI